MNTVIKYGITFLAIALLILLPETLIFREDLSLCIFKSLSGKECPLCGMTRAAYHLIRLQPQAAIYYNPLIVFIPLLYALEISGDLFPHKLIVKVKTVIWIVFVCMLAILFVVRITHP